jgi:hypothetical protein
MSTATIGLLLVLGAPPQGGDAKVEASDSPKSSDAASVSATDSASESVKVEQKTDGDDAKTTVEKTSTGVSSDVSAQPEPAPTVAPAPDPNAAPPKPTAPPDGVAAIGSGAQAPLPQPKPPVDPSTIKQGPWRGAGWISLRLTVGGPIGGEFPAKARVVAIGGGGEIGWRVRNYIGVFAGLYRGPHDQGKRVVTDPATGVQLEVLDTGHMTNIDFAVARVFWPLDGRIQPYVDLGGGMAILEPPDPSDPVQLGGHFRGGLGFDAWVARSVTLGFGLIYRANAVDDTVGHHLQGFAGLGLHW